MTKQKACKVCKRIYDNGNKCPDCGSPESIEGYKGRVIVLNPEKSEIAKKLNVSKKGNFAIKVR